MTEQQAIPTERLEQLAAPSSVLVTEDADVVAMARRLLFLEPEVERLRDCYENAGHDHDVSLDQRDATQAELAKLRERQPMLEAALDYANDADSDSIDLQYHDSCAQNNALLGAFQKARDAYRAATAPDPVDALREKISTLISAGVDGDETSEDISADILDVIRAHPEAIDRLRKEQA